MRAVGVSPDRTATPGKLLKQHSRSDDDTDESSEFEKMKQGLLRHVPVWKQHAYAARVQKMDLNALECDTLAFTIRQFKRYGIEGSVWHRRGNLLFAVQMVCAAVVPVLIGLLGSFDSLHVDLAIRLVAIMLSIMGTFCNVLESAYQFRERGQRRKTFANRMSANFENFVSLSAPPFNTYALPDASDQTTSSDWPQVVTIPDLSTVPLPLLQTYINHRQERKVWLTEQSCAPASHTGENFRQYCHAFNQLQEECRKSSFVSAVGAASSDDWMLGPRTSFNGTSSASPALLRNNSGSADQMAV